MRSREHSLIVSVAGVDIDGWISATIESDVLTPGDAFTLTHAYDPRAFALLRLDAEVTVCVDGAPILNGFIESRQGDFSSFTVSGKDRVGRMVAESAPLGLDFKGRDLLGVARELAAPWFDSVVLSNAENRDLMRGQGKKTRNRGAPLLEPRTDDRRVAPGASKWDALDDLLHRAGYLAWSSANGRDLIIARPDYDQDAQFAFYATAEASNCKNITYQESNASRYAAIVTVATGRGQDLERAAHATGRWGVARDNPETFNGVGRNFTHAKRLVIPVEAGSQAECQRLAERERAEREAVSFEVAVSVWGFGQTIAPADAPTLYAPDIVVDVRAENTPVDGAYYVTARTFQLSRSEEETRLRCVPLGVFL